MFSSSAGEFGGVVTEFPLCESYLYTWPWQHSLQREKMGESTDKELMNCLWLWVCVCTVTCKNKSMFISSLSPFYQLFPLPSRLHLSDLLILVFCWSGAITSSALRIIQKRKNLLVLFSTVLYSHALSVHLIAWKVHLLSALMHDFCSI